MRNETKGTNAKIIKLSVCVNLNRSADLKLLVVRKFHSIFAKLLIRTTSKIVWL